MVNPGSFQGARKEFLLSQKAEYETAVKDRRSAETLLQIQRRFFKRFPIDLPDDWEPTEEQLASINDDAPDAEFSDPGDGSEADAPVTSSQKKKKKSKRAKQSSKSKKNRIAFRREQIKRWMAYQYAKDNVVKEKENGVFNPYKILLPRFINGIKNKAPRRRPALNIWRQTKRTEINDALAVEVNAAIASGNPIPSSHFATRREGIARSMYNKLPDEDKEHWERVADEEHELAKAQHEQQEEAEISTSPADRQRAIQLLPAFIKPILDLVNDVTGWKSSFIGGGPEPALNGQFSIMSIHSGTTNGPIPMNFGTAQRANYKKYFVPTFGNFLQGCFDPDECKARALDPQEGFLPMSSLMESDESANTEHAPSAFMHHVDETPLPRGPTFTPNPSIPSQTTTEDSDSDKNSDGVDDDSNDIDPFPFGLNSSPCNSVPPSPTLSAHGSPSGAAIPPIYPEIGWSNTATYQGTPNDHPPSSHPSIDPRLSSSNSTPNVQTPSPNTTVNLQPLSSNPTVNSQPPSSNFTTHNVHHRSPSSNHAVNPQSPSSNSAVNLQPPSSNSTTHNLQLPTSASTTPGPQIPSSNIPSRLENPTSALLPPSSIPVVSSQMAAPSLKITLPPMNRLPSAALKNTSTHPSSTKKRPRTAAVAIESPAPAPVGVRAATEATNPAPLKRVRTKSAKALAMEEPQSDMGKPSNTSTKAGAGPGRKKSKDRQGGKKSV